LPAAREKVRVARALPALPKISEAFRLGRLSYAKVRALTRIATPANEDTLLGWAEYGHASHLEKLARLYRRYGDDAAARAQYRQRECSYYTDEDGSLVIRARLPAELGAVFLKALEAARSELQDVSAETHPSSIEANATDVSAETPPSPDGMDPAVSGDEDVSAETRGPWLHWKDHSTTWDPDASAEAEPDTRFRRNADAIVRLAERYLAPDAEPRALGERFQVHVHLDLCRRASGPVDDPDTPSVSRETIRRLGCESNLVPVGHDGESGEILSVGRRTRAIPPHIRRALRLRDGGCRFPGCTNHKYVEAHHVVHWADGGETKLSNLLELCRFHHRLLHEGGFGLTGTDDGLLVFSRPERQPHRRHSRAPGYVVCERTGAGMAASRAAHRPPYVQDEVGRQSDGLRHRDRHPRPAQAPPASETPGPVGSWLTPASSPPVPPERPVVPGTRPGSCARPAALRTGRGRT
jgi:hypothetical protein